MVEFNVLGGMNWLAPYHAVLDYFAKTVTLALPSEPNIAWKGALYSGPQKVISYVQACRLVRGCLDYLDHIRDTSVVSPTFLDFVRVVHEFMNVFSTNFLGMPLDCEVDFPIDIDPCTKISLFLLQNGPRRIEEIEGSVAVVIG